MYDVKPLFGRIDAFKVLENDPALFSDVTVDVGGYGVVWNDDLDLSCDELFENGNTVKTPFDGLMAFSDATLLWGLSSYAESVINVNQKKKKLKNSNLRSGVNPLLYRSNIILYAVFLLKPQILASSDKFIF